MTGVDRAVGSTMEAAREFIEAVEAKDIDAVARTLWADAEQLFPHSVAVTTLGVVADIARLHQCDL